METIDAEILAFILDIEKAIANKKIVAYLERRVGNSDYMINVVIGSGKKIADMEIQSGVRLYGENESCDIEGLSKYQNLDLEFAIKNIRETFLTSPTTRGWILNYPSTKLKVNKVTRKMPKRVSIPKPLRSLLTETDKQTIIKIWEDKYYTSTPGDPINDVRFSIN